jgi:CheY-like chemotaxis protein/anti-sigma regulatory factor (Ser/Thr protein kinase)
MGGETKPQAAHPAVLKGTDHAGGRELELTALRDAAERASRAKSRLLAEVAHELRTPLQGAVELLEGSGQPGEDPTTSALRATLAHLSTVIDDLADMGALEAGGIALARSAFDLGQALQDVAAMHRAANRDRRIEVNLADCPLVIGDQVRVRQVVSNLLSNALKHGEGDVGLTLAAETSGETVITTIQVTDNGPGVAPEDLATIFEPFRRAGREDTDGLGLGLPIARRIAIAMGGELRAVSTSEGSRFEFCARLPRADRAGSRVPSAGARVLLVEDVDLSRRVLAGLLSREGCEVMEARDGREALGLWAASQADFVITDERMPHLCGSELAKGLRERGFRGPIAIVAGVDDAELRTKVALIPQVTILRKPLDRAALRTWLRPGTPLPPSSPVRSDRVRELVEALGPAADQVFAELPAELNALTKAALDSLDAGRGSDVVDASHRLAGLAEHFGLAQVADAARALEIAAREPQTLAPAERSSHAREIREAVAAVPWRRYGR